MSQPSGATELWCVLIEENVLAHGYWVLKHVAPYPSRELCLEYAAEATRVYRPHTHRRRRVDRSVFQHGDDSWVVRMHTALGPFTSNQVCFRVTVARYLGDYDSDGRPRQARPPWLATGPLP